MPYINIKIRDKVATADNGAVIVADNNDYVAVFDFDDEWSFYPTKTARFVYGDNYTDVVFSGSSCNVPVITYNGYEHMGIGVYAGDIHTTTPAIIVTTGSITSGDHVHADPPEDVYNQIMDMLNGFSASVEKVGHTATVTITDPHGTTTAEIHDGEAGAPGAPGADGHTPVRGVDYWTDADKAEIVDDVVQILMALREPPE